MKMNPLKIILFLYISKTLCECVSYKNELISPFTNIAFSNTTVYVGGNGGIVSLDKTNLSEISSNTKIKNNWLLNDVSDTNEIVQCNENQENTSVCVKLNSTLASSLISSPKITVNVSNKPVSTNINIPAVNTNVVVIAASSMGISNNTYGILTLDVENLTLFLTSEFKRGPLNVERGEDFDLVFKSTFVHSGYLYFVFQVWNETGVFVSSKIGKLCLNNTNKNSNRLYYHSYEDMEIKCNSSSHVIQYATIAGDHVVALFTDGKSSIVCRYTLEDVSIKFLESRKHATRCRTSYFPGRRYFDPSITLGQGSVNCILSNGTCLKGPVACRELEGNFCNTEIHQTVLGQQGIDAMPVCVVDKVVTTADVLLVYNSAVLYIGTDEGFVGKIYLDSKTENLIPYSVNRYTSKVLQISTTESGIYVLTEDEIGRLEYRICSIFNTCSSCMLTEHPYCGWDYIQQRCRSNNTESLWWIPSVSGSCIKITGLSNGIMIEDGKNVNNNVLFDIVGPNEIPDHIKNPNKETHFCKIGGSETFYSRKDSQFQCSMNLQSFETDNYTLSVRFENITFAEKTIEIYRCTYFTECNECTRREKCLWSADGFSCGRSVPGGSGETEKCPRLDSSNILLHRKDYPVNFTFHVKKFNQFKTVNVNEDLKCELSKDTADDKVELPIVYINSTSVTCLELNLTSTSSGLTQYMLRIKKGNRYIDNYVLLRVYFCNGLLEGERSCRECRHLRRKGYDCYWCHSEDMCYNPGSESCTDDSTEGCIPKITKVSPKAGPVNGGTVITIIGEDIGSKEDNITIEIGSVKCQPVTVKQAFKKLTCLTGKVNSTRNNSAIIIKVNSLSSTADQHLFSYKDPQLVDFEPTKGIVAGNTSITIFGNDTGFVGLERFKISFCNDTHKCVECRIIGLTRKGNIVCRTGSIDTPQEMTSLHVVIDSETNLTLQKSFNYSANPTFLYGSNSTKVTPSDNTGSVLQSGGVNIVINGEGFNNVAEVTIDRVDKPCDVPSDTEVICGSPELEPSINHTSDQPIKQTVNVHFDGYTIEIELKYVGDPVFEMFNGILKYDGESAIQIKGRYLLRGARQDDYSVQIGLDGRCFMNQITMETISCFPPANTPRTNNSNINIVHVVVEVGRIKKYIGEIEYTTEFDVLPIVAGILGASFLASVIVGVTAILVLRRKKKKAIKQFQMELVSREEIIRKASREEFADAQMTMRDIKTDLVTSKVPYCNYQKYIFRQLFPNQDMESNSLCQNTRVTDDDKLKEKAAIDKLDKLLTNKLFLKSLVQTLDRQQKLTLREKANFASVLSISLLGNMKLYYDLITCLLVDMVESTPKKQQKIIFRRFESIALRLTVNWLQIVLYEQLKSQCGIQLFLLYRAVQSIVERAPIDALTGNSKNTLAEEKLLKMRLEYETLTLHIDLNGNSELHYPVKVLDCDTISQVKQKCCMQFYKNKPASEIPDNKELVLEWHEGVGGRHVLDDIDAISERGNGMVRLNTLKHYMIKDESKMALMYKEHEEVIDYENISRYRVQSVTSDDINLLIDGENEKTNEDTKIHLESTASNLSDDVKSAREQDIGDIFLNRLFHTKLLMSDYIDTTFEGLLDPSSLSIPVRYFMGMIDKLGKDFDADSEVVQTWKSECYATRLWALLIARPQIIFDVHVPNYVEPCMDILNQVFVEIFSHSSQKVNKESSTQKLLFHKDIARYKKLIHPFFVRIDPVTDQEFWTELSNISERQKMELTFSRQAAVSQLYNLFIGKYKNEIIENFDEMDDSKDLGFGVQLEEITELMEES